VVVLGRVVTVVTVVLVVVVAVTPAAAVGDAREFSGAIIAADRTHQHLLASERLTRSEGAGREGGATAGDAAGENTVSHSMQCLFIDRCCLPTPSSTYLKKFGVVGRTSLGGGGEHGCRRLDGPFLHFWLQ
jgi:hypothetical protein